jgi:two-component system sensor histidine kinase HydH
MHSLFPYAILFLSWLASISFFISGLYTQHIIEKTLDTALRLQAVGVEITLKSFLKNLDLDLLKEKKNVFSDLLLNPEWEGVAYLAIYNDEGKILLHSNPELIGRYVGASGGSPSTKTRQSSQPLPRSFYHDSPLGERLYIFENSVNLKDKKAILRIGLHILPVEEALLYAKRRIYLDFFLSLLFFFGGVVSFFLIRRLYALREKIEDLERWQFISKTLAHEMKNPLASIKGFAQLSLRRVDDEKAKKAQSLILKEALRLERLLENLSSYTHPKPLKLSLFELRDLLTEVIETFKLLYPSADLGLNYKGEDFNVYSDRDKLKQVLINLLENALQAGSERGVLKVDVDLMAEDKSYIIRIKDYGKGVPEGELKRIWEPFYTTKTKGMGLGLTIVKRLCEELNCKIEIRSKEGAGTEVWLKIPR